MAMPVFCSVLFLLVQMKSFVQPSVNIALNKPAEQSSGPYGKGYASLVTDGCLLQDFGCGRNTRVPRPANCPSENCCAHQAEFQNFTWLRVDLQKEVEIKSVTIYVRTDYRKATLRIKGYKVYTSKTRNYTATDLCFEHLDSSNPESIVSHDCHSLSRYVTLTNTFDPRKGNRYHNQALLEVCELQVFGCQVGFYGNKACNYRCPNTCRGGRCDPDTGVCYEWCPHNCRGSCDPITGMCSECEYGFHGDNCTEKCDSNCFVCSKSDGSCLVCTEGYSGPGCVPVSSGWFNQSSDNPVIKTKDVCPPSCLNGLCDSSARLCNDCIPGFYGNSCTDKCTKNCFACDQYNGTCLVCVEGYNGPNCNSSPSDFLSQPSSSPFKNVKEMLKQRRPDVHALTSTSKKEGSIGTGAYVIGAVGCLIGLIGLMFGIVLYAKMKRLEKREENEGVTFQKGPQDGPYAKLVQI